MAGDYTRVTFNPREGLTRACSCSRAASRSTRTANELVDADRPAPAGRDVDTLGRCVVSRETPSAFLIALSGGALTIGRGRAYVDGLLAENHGADADGVRPGARRGARHRPDRLRRSSRTCPNAATLAPLPPTGTYLVYLDVWQREVTALEDPELVEKAVGVDTTTRLQTVWQVRLLEAADGDT